MFIKSKKNYRISLNTEDWVAPEETLLDSGSDYSDIEKPISSSIFQFFLFFFISLGAILLAFVFKIAVIDHEVFAKLALQNKSANFSLPPPRGIITDRNGKVLAMNIPIFNLLGVSREIKENDEILTQNISKIAEILELEKDSLERTVKEQAASNSTFFISLGLSKDQALALTYLELPGFYIIPDTKREYESGQKIAQIIGYTGKVSRDDLARDEYYFPTDTIGRLGIEAQYEEYLRGEHGNIFFSKDDKVGYATKDPGPGKTLVLNLNYALQIKLYDEIFEVLRGSGLNQAAAVIQNPQNGEVLALTSFPSFDNNIFSSNVSESDYTRLFENNSKPLFNRVISGTYNPGSTIKPIMALMALEEKIISPQDTIKDCVSITVPNPFDPSSPYVFKNWRTEFGLFNLKRAIANSCNVYFYTIGGGYENIKGLGAEKISSYLKQASADAILDIDIPGEAGGFVPTPEWKLRERGEPWYLGDTYNTSIGQGDLLVTPLWINSYVSAISNGGTIYRPRIADKIIGKGDGSMKEFTEEKILTLPFSGYAINVVKEAMRETVVSGTAKIFDGLPVKVGAKTGTAEVLKGRTINSLFTAFAPYDNPKLAITILIEGSDSNQGLAIKAAYEVLKWYFENNN